VSSGYEWLKLSRQRLFTVGESDRVTGQIQPRTATENGVLRSQFRDEGTPEIIRQLGQGNSTEASDVGARLVGRFDVKLPQRAHRLLSKGTPSGRKQNVSLSRAINGYRTIRQVLERLASEANQLRFCDPMGYFCEQRSQTLAGNHALERMEVADSPWGPPFP
jgi:hypothetical protein